MLKQKRRLIVQDDVATDGAELMPMVHVSKLSYGVQIIYFRKIVFFLVKSCCVVID
jgi:hypothetical protein